MSVRALRFSSILFTAVCLGAGLAHLPNKIGLPSQAYLTVQQVYRGWAFLGIVVLGALVSNLLLSIAVRRRPRVFPLSLAAFACVAVALIVFFAFTYPANPQTHNWTILPPNWESLREQWEYSHALGAGMYFLALSLLVLSVLIKQERRVEKRRIY